MKVKEDFFSRGSFRVRNGETTRFWEDTWLGNTPLKDQYPLLYNIVQHQNVSIHDVFHNSAPLNIGFRRALVGNKWDMWSHLCVRLMDVTLTDEPDEFVWKLTQNRIFTVKLMYEDLMNGHTRFLQTYLWTLKIPLKIKVLCGSFMKKCYLQRIT